MKNEEIEKEHNEFQEKWNKERLEYGMPEEHFKHIAVGYLSIDEDFEKDEVSQNFLNKLRILWSEGMILGSLGSHECEFCIDEGNYEGRGRSSEEKELVDRENKIRYFFPKMIFHYIEVHKFKPSNEFIEFVMKDSL